MPHAKPKIATRPKPMNQPPPQDASGAEAGRSPKAAGPRENREPSQLHVWLHFDPQRTEADTLLRGIRSLPGVVTANPKVGTSQTSAQEQIRTAASGFTGAAEELVVALASVAEEIATELPLGQSARSIAQIRAIGSADRLLRTEGAALSAADFAHQAGITPATLRRYQRAGRVIAVPRGRTQVLYPAWQVHHHRLLPGLVRVLAALRGLADRPLSLVAFFVTHQEALRGASPLELLRAGGASNLARVERAAAVCNERFGPGSGSDDATRDG
ncbi:hypothetical protein [Actomonas aquatica]|uniref:HTH merR-type domain-containing protein n=1 Tax=Actomonas aquatica TaxID=2866162 RepID=A0ABZ1C2L4_9BACT|nr:hypothetical protein [Opitutus sp. WL0086]WRQ85547.1 hypothetical protein K1X11_012110 [Opitutus sp. WL0086]